MDLIPTSRAMLMTATPQDPRCVAIAERYGDFTAFVNKWKPENLTYIAQNVDNSADTPSLVMMMLTYGQENISDHIKLVLIWVVKEMRENNINMADIERISKLITESKPLRLLNYAFLLTFFAKIMQGEYDLYSCKPHQFMAAFHKYAVTARARQDEIERVKRQAEEDREWEEHRKSAITFEEFKRRTGYTGENPISQLQSV